MKVWSRFLAFQSRDHRSRIFLAGSLITTMAIDSSQSGAANQQVDATGCLLSVAITVGRIFVHAFAGLVVFLLLVSGFREAWQVFDALELKVPETTAIVSKWMHWANRYWLFLLPGTLLIDSLIMIGLELLPRGYRWLARIWFSGVLVAALLASAFIYFATLPPFMELPHFIEELKSHDAPESAATYRDVQLAGSSPAIVPADDLP